LGKQVAIGSVVYSATKSFVTFFTASIGFELFEENFTNSTFFSFDETMVDIQCLMPGPLDDGDRSTIAKTMLNTLSYSPSKVV